MLGREKSKKKSERRLSWNFLGKERRSGDREVWKSEVMGSEII